MSTKPEYRRAEVEGWLGIKLVTGRCSRRLVDQLTAHTLNRTLDVFAVYDEIGALESAPTTRPSSTKPATPFSGPVLQGLWHKHFSTPAFIVQNLANHWNAKRLGTLVEDVAADESIPTDKKVALLAHRIVLGGHEARHRQGRVTGEWIVFLRQSSGNVYLTLATHTEADEAIRARVDLAAAKFTDLHN